MAAQAGRSLAYDSAEALMFGTATQPVTAGFGVQIGAGQVVPEVNYTLPTMSINEGTLEQVRACYRGMVGRILERCVELDQPAVVLEFEQLFELTQHPDWGAAITTDTKELMAASFAQHGLHSALRVTVADIRDMERPPKMRSGEPRRIMLESFEQCAVAGADILSIESTGGKEVTDPALLSADLDGLAYGLGVLAARDMHDLWTNIAEVALKHGCIAGGDTACGYGNTAMQLAHQKMVPGVLAAVVRLMTAARSLAAVDAGAVGPLKDCGYENPVIKALTGVPISMEGKSSACAHSSPLGNIAAWACDLWSNESVQDVRLLGGFAPESFAEILVYDCRLMNTALRQGGGAQLRGWLVESDVHGDPQAKVLEPAVMYGAAERIAHAGPCPYAQTVALARFALEVLNTAYETGELQPNERDNRWRTMLSEAAAALPDDPDELRARIDLTYGGFYLPEEYGL